MIFVLRSTLERALTERDHARWIAADLRDERDYAFTRRDAHIQAAEQATLRAERAEAFLATSERERDALREERDRALAMLDQRDLELNLARGELARTSVRGAKGQFVKRVDV